MAQRTPRGPRPWLDEFQLDGSGAYAYRGSHRKFSGDSAQYQKFRLTLAVCTALLCGCAVAAGCLNVGALDNTFYVLIPYMLEVVSAAAFAWTAVRLLVSGSVLRSYVWKQTVRRLPVLSGLLAGLALATDVCAVVFFAVNGAWNVTGGVYLLLHGVVCAAALYSFKAIKSSRWDTV